MLGTFAHHVGAPLQVHPGSAADEQLAEGRHRVAGQRTEGGVVGRHVTPAEDGETFGLDDLLHRLAGRRGIARRLWQERDTRGIATRLGQLELADCAKELVGNLQQDACAVTGVRFGALGAAMLHVQQRGDGLVDDVAAAPAVHVGDHRDTTGIMLIGGVVQTLPQTLAQTLPQTRVQTLVAGRHSHLPLHTFTEA